MSNKDIYIIFSKTGTLFSNVISFFTQKEFAHTSISLDPTFQTMYSFGRINPAYVLPAGFVEENLYSGVYSMFPESKCLIYKISVTTEQYSSLKKYIDNFLIDKSGFVEENLYSGVYSMFPESKCLIYKISVTTEQYSSLKKYIDNFLIDKSKYKYSVLGTATLLFNKPTKRENYYFCSQFVAEALIEAGIYKTDKLPELIRPMDLLELENKSLLYSGKINEYPLYNLYSTDESYSIFDLPDKLPELIRPMDLLELENKSLLYSGKINEYPLYNLYSTDESYSIFDLPHSLASAAYGKIRNRFI